MPTAPMTVVLDELDLAALNELTEHDNPTVADVLTMAVRTYIVRRSRSDADWRHRWDEAVANIRRGVPEDVTPEEIEADIFAAREEVRREASGTLPNLHEQGR